MPSEQPLYSVSEVADIFSVSKAVVESWGKSGKLTARREGRSGKRIYAAEDVRKLDPQNPFFHTGTPTPRPVPLRPYRLIELFAGAGGLALGLERAGMHSLMLNEIDRNACATLRANRPDWYVIQGGVANIDFKAYQGKADILAGGFPCQAFSYAGRKLGFKDTRGTLFYEWARAIDETRPAVVVAENVRGLLRHDGGRTLETMLAVIRELGYSPLEPRVLKAIHHRVPQKRERLIIAAFRNDVACHAGFGWPVPEGKIYTVRDALKRGELFPSDVPESPGERYTVAKAKVMGQVPPGGYWRDLPESVQREYMQKSFFLGGGKTGMARRMSWDEPCLTLTCSPAQKQTERCHPEETRPFTIREYARIQTFPDDWEFSGSRSSVYKQIGNAVPVNLAEALGLSIVAAMNRIEAAQAPKALLK
ncbi:DNA (cytosine-5-)-methyltransferase [Akkermansiaceae bacterium]|nr:DNA (cytosine-5-)-methyltransferase [Akkermansiaceae bacterium]